MWVVRTSDVRCLMFEVIGREAFKIAVYTSIRQSFLTSGFRRSKVLDTEFRFLTVRILIFLGKHFRFPVSNIRRFWPQNSVFRLFKSKNLSQIARSTAGGAGQRSRKSGGGIHSDNNNKPIQLFSDIHA